MRASADRAASPSLADDLERRLDLDDFSFLNQPSVVSSLAQSSARGEGSVRRGEFSGAAPVASTPQLFGGGFASGAQRQVHSAPGKLQPGLLKAIHITPSNVNNLCLGFVGASKVGVHARFCVARKLKGENHCGVGSHGSIKSKMAVGGATFWLPGGSILEKATARTSPFLLEADMSQDDIEYIQAQKAPATRWPEYFKRIQNLIDSRKRATDVSRESPVDVEEVEDESEREEETSDELREIIRAYKRDLGDYGDGTGKAEVWTDIDSEEEEDEDERQELLELVAALRRTVEKQAETIKNLTDRLDEDKSLRELEALRCETTDLHDNLGDLIGLVQDHGSVSQVVTNLLTRQDHSEAELASVASDITALSSVTSTFAFGRQGGNPD